MSWDYRFGALILLSTIIDYYVGWLLTRSQNRTWRLFLLNFSLITNLVFILGFFKYYNFLASTTNSFSLWALDQSFLPVLDIILPAGISFFTFQSLSYTIDVYKGEIPAERDFIRFALFVSFFPQLVAGPIVTAKTFIPQLHEPKRFEDIPFRVAVRYFMLGYFKKAVLSDQIAPTIDMIFTDPTVLHTGTLWIGAVLGGTQVYLDFSGYSDMAIGSALLLGYKLPTNFNLPFKASSVSEFWRRWHMTLNFWLRDYIYFSLGGSRVSSLRRKFNIWFTMFVSGVWHGANWTYVFWGSLNGFFYMVEEFYRERWGKPKGETNPFPKLQFMVWFLKMSLTNLLFFLGAVFFRSANFTAALQHLKGMFLWQTGVFRTYIWKEFLWVSCFLILGHCLGHYLWEEGKEKQIPASLELAIYPIVVLILALFTPENSVPFIYFQF
ncbi:DltB-like membrane protein [Leptospira ryugenii]|uniref:DltB-like membrane protein n=2 Tax=Leptospira ryugenii TaxID=1917863 RepID=A0A2P2E4E0_9LEPT|nr:DltB-like membrane protein [Leptospira ryugenii]